MRPLRCSKNTASRPAFFGNVSFTIVDSESRGKRRIRLPMTTFSQSRRIANGWTAIPQQPKDSAMGYFLGAVGLCGVFSAIALTIILLASNRI